MNSDILLRVGEILSKNQAGVIVLPTNASLDAAAAATALYLSLNINSKSVGLACENTKFNYDLVGINKIHDELVTTGDNLVVLFQTTEQSTRSIIYPGDSFNLVITPPPTSPNLIRKG
jgi:hypothetical protein